MNPLNPLNPLNLEPLNLEPLNLEPLNLSKVRKYTAQSPPLFVLSNKSYDKNYRKRLSRPRIQTG